jgi:hypothetical protein
MSLVSMGTAVAPFWSGAIDSVGALLVIAGADKVYGVLHGARRESAIRRAFRIEPRRWQRVQLTAGLAECVTGFLVCGRVFPAEGGAAMAGLGVVFAGSLIYARRAGAPGGCGCISWNKRATSETIKLREIIRAEFIVIIGILSLAMRWPVSAPFREPWFYAGTAAGCLLLLLLSLDVVPTPLRCGWRRLLMTHSTLDTLTHHPVFKAILESVGPFTPEFGYHATGCTEEYWFASSDGAVSAPQVAAFSVTRLPGGVLAVHARLQDSMPENLRLNSWVNEPA